MRKEVTYIFAHDDSYEERDCFVDEIQNRRYVGSNSNPTDKPMNYHGSGQDYKEINATLLQKEEMEDTQFEKERTLLFYKLDDVDEYAIATHYFMYEDGEKYEYWDIKFLDRMPS